MFGAMTKLPPLPPFPGKSGNEPTPTAATRYEPCPFCGQIFDTHSIDEVLHHSEEPHEPRERP